MLINLALGLSVMLLCLLSQCLLLIFALRFYTRHHARLKSPNAGPHLVLLMTVMGLLVLGNLFQVGIWAWVFYGLGEFEYFSTAFYHSAVNFATLGYGDIVMTERWRLLGPLESLNGIIMVGVSTSSLLWTVQDTLKLMLAQQNKNHHSD